MTVVSVTSKATMYQELSVSLELCAVLSIRSLGVVDAVAGLSTPLLNTSLGMYVCKYTLVMDVQFSLHYPYKSESLATDTKRRIIS